MEVTIFWVGTSKAGSAMIGVKYFSKGFACKKFVEVEDASLFGVGQVIDIPKEALQ